MTPAVTFAVVGRNEERHLANALRLAVEAASPVDRVVFVDSDSDDDSALVAARAGVETILAPRGKGAAIRTAVDLLDTEWLVLLDADLIDAEHNIADILARSARVSDTPGHLLGEFRGKDGGDVLSNTWIIYEPLVAALFPECVVAGATKPLTGFRALSLADLPSTQSMPVDFGIEAWFNIELQLAGYATTVVTLGWYEGPFKYKPRMGAEIAAGILEAAERHGRLTPRSRPAWDAWVENQVEIVATYTGGDAERRPYLNRLRRARDHPLPPSR